jgi:hypothetical protein
MTVTVYQATFANATGKKFNGSISSDKYTPRRLGATICPHITVNEVDYPIWTAKDASTRSGLASLVRKMRSKATQLGFTVVKEGETAYANAVEK